MFLMEEKAATLSITREAKRGERDQLKVSIELSNAFHAPNASGERRERTFTLI